MFEIQQNALTALPAVDEGGGNAGLATTTLMAGQKYTQRCHTGRWQHDPSPAGNVRRRKSRQWLNSVCDLVIQ